MVPPVSKTSSTPSRNRSFNRLRRPFTQDFHAAIPLHWSAILRSRLIGIPDRSRHWLLILSQICPRGSKSSCILWPPFDP
uniref:Uncharacterized protein n=1 Tax=Cucumis sativus TaxID=3659 RepID=A0A0A0KW63_CUCSA